MKLVIAADHAAIETKAQVVEFLRTLGHQVEDIGPHTKERVDYPDFAQRACKLLVQDECDRVVLLCGSGIGMAMSANKVPGCRAAVIHDPWEGAMSRRHNNANVACFGARSMGIEMIQAGLKVWLETEFEGGRHAGRVAKMNALDGSAAADVPGE
jgi:ribose 5-phosphate isomerase B